MRLSYYSISNVTTVFSTAEKQRRYHQRRDANPNRRDTYLKSWMKRKELGKPICELNEKTQLGYARHGGWNVARTDNKRAFCSSTSRYCHSTENDFPCPPQNRPRETRQRRKTIKYIARLQELFNSQELRYKK